MKIKPKGLWYLLPVGLLFTSVIIGVILFFQAVITPLMNVENVELNQTYEKELGEGSWISLYVEDEDIISYSFEEFNDVYRFTYETTSSTYSVIFDVDRIDGDDIDSGFYYQVFDPSTEAYTVDEFTNFADVNITTDGTYRIIFSSYDDIQVKFGAQFTNWDIYGVKIIAAMIVLVVGISLAIVSFIVIIIMRSNAKKHIHTIPFHPNLDHSFVKQNENEKKDVDDNFDY
jgi:hypothetical protein